MVASGRHGMGWRWRVLQCDRAVSGGVRELCRGEYNSPVGFHKRTRRSILSQRRPHPRQSTAARAARGIPCPVGRAELSGEVRCMRLVAAKVVWWAVGIPGTCSRERTGSTPLPPHPATDHPRPLCPPGPSSDGDPWRGELHVEQRKAPAYRDTVDAVMCSEGRACV